MDKEYFRKNGIKTITIKDFKNFLKGVDSGLPIVISSYVDIRAGWLDISCNMDHGIDGIEIMKDKVVISIKELK